MGASLLANAIAVNAKKPYTPFKEQNNTLLLPSSILKIFQGCIALQRISNGRDPSIEN
jgi:hypothetical protein